ncbi:MAG TPA: outer membrane beta-barrel protein [Myxococcaceae bacterium]|nr:outer membrane beta-barrel protein [Myxococcaceae bacterium]
MGAGLLLLALLSTAEAGPASVFDEDRVGFEVGGRASLGQTYWVLAAAGPTFGVDVRLRFGPHLGLGFALETGFSKSPDVDHPWTLHRKQLAFDVQWRFDTGPSIRPWVSLGMGFGTIDLEYDDLAFRSSAHTVDFARLGLGVDFLVGRFLALGPFVRGSLGHTRLTAADDPPGSDTGRSLDSLDVGVRVLFGF